MVHVCQYYTIDTWNKSGRRASVNECETRVQYSWSDNLISGIDVIYYFNDEHKKVA